MMSLEFPKSRISSSGQCELCKGQRGYMENAGKVFLQDENSNKVELLKWTCNYCGHTILFDMNIVRNTPLQDQEVLPE